MGFKNTILAIWRYYLSSKEQILGKSNRNPLLDVFDFAFWTGDLNFRINGTRRIVDSLLKYNMHETLVNNDQLTTLLKVDPWFVHFAEGPLHFRPTYKFKRDTGEFRLPYQKERKEASQFFFLNPKS